MKKKQKIVKKLLWICLILFILMNIIANFHAYKFTHFSDNNAIVKTKSPEKLTTTDKLNAIVFGINNPRPSNIKLPTEKYEKIVLQSNKKIECWHIKIKDTAKGTVILFHGYSGEKSSMLNKSDELNALGYNTILVDFMGSGGSEGKQTTLGFKEAEQVKTVYDYAITIGEKNIYLMGTSMGAVAILKAINDYQLTPKAIVLECPFGSMYQTTCARFNNMKAPAFPMAGLLVFWGGVQNNFWAFGHKPTKYAKNTNCPVLLLYGEQDQNVSRQEIDAIYSNLNGSKTLKIYPNAGHEDYLIQYKNEWRKDVEDFFQFY